MQRVLIPEKTKSKYLLLKKQRSFTLVKSYVYDRCLSSVFDFNIFDERVRNEQFPLLI